jgi:uncharacterized protein YigE (DUF2233 family)
LKTYFIAAPFILLLLAAPRGPERKSETTDAGFVSYVADPAKEEVRLYWKNEKGERFGSLGNLKNWLLMKKKTLRFAMNGGMYMTDGSPLGLYVENGKVLKTLNKSSGGGNFYLKPNGVFYLTTDKKAVVSTSEKYPGSGSVAYATQSGPMLVTDGRIHSSFKKGSSNLNIRNGVGILPGNKILFVMSKGGVSLYDFAAYFLEKGCRNALYLDGFVSRTYVPEQGLLQEDGNFGVMVGITEAAKNQ